MQTSWYEIFLCWLEVYAIGSVIGCVLYALQMIPFEIVVTKSATTVGDAYNNPTLKFQKVIGRFYGNYPDNMDTASIDLCMPIKVNKLTKIIYPRGMLTYSDEVMFLGRVKVEGNGGTIDRVIILSTTDTLWIGRYKRKLLKNYSLLSMGVILVWKIVVVASLGITVWL